MLATERAADPVAPGLVEAEVELVVAASVGVAAVGVGVAAVSVGVATVSGEGVLLGDSMVILPVLVTMERQAAGSEWGKGRRV